MASGKMQMRGRLRNGGADSSLEPGEERVRNEGDLQYRPRTQEDVLRRQERENGSWSWQELVLLFRR